ncbi:hypothetical protein PITC_056730 [Penicillium italicum]|uniref:NmrA-like domain-containing protein n=1 Tax=Penicillium italicum TaxID=40296 RepID=A0A0A2KXZ1_PENIT|nr:hypothetical protein PITC_056730 [Penicillium italicum]
MSAPRKTVLVTGATGKQGGALVQSLISAPDTAGYNIVAVTHDVTSPRALKLPEAIFRKVSPIRGIFSVQVNSNAEEQQGKAIVDAAVAHRVRQFFYSSGDRGGPKKSPANSTKDKTFAAKHHGANNLNPTTDISGKGFACMWEQMGDGKLQFVSTKNIGWGDELIQKEAKVMFCRRIIYAYGTLRYSFCSHVIVEGHRGRCVPLNFKAWTEENKEQ